MGVNRGNSGGDIGGEPGGIVGVNRGDSGGEPGG